MTIKKNIAIFVLLFCCIGHIPSSIANQRSFEFHLLPGESRVISHSRSASRDTGALAYQILPRAVLSLGGDFAFFRFQFSKVSLLVGMFGLVEVETVEPAPLNFLTVPSGPYLWRGLLGYSTALSFDEAAQRILGSRGALEAALSFRHESEHYTGSPQGNPLRDSNVPNIGDFFMPDLAIRKAFGPLDIESRVQMKLFLPTGSHGYSVGPGGDLVFRLRQWPIVNPFFSVFGEYLFGREIERVDDIQQVQDNYIVRGLAGLILVGEAADLQLFAALSVGHGKGLLADFEEVCLGWGIRVAFLKRGFQN